MVVLGVELQAAGYLIGHRAGEHRHYFVCYIYFLGFDSEVEQHIFRSGVLFIAFDEYGGRGCVDFGGDLQVIVCRSEGHGQGEDKPFPVAEHQKDYVFYLGEAFSILPERCGLCGSFGPCGG